MTDRPLTRSSQSAYPIPKRPSNLQFDKSLNAKKNINEVIPAPEKEPQHIKALKSDPTNPVLVTKSQGCYITANKTKIKKPSHLSVSQTFMDFEFEKLYSPTPVGEYERSEQQNLGLRKVKTPNKIFTPEIYKINGLQIPSPSSLKVGPFEGFQTTKIEIKPKNSHHGRNNSHDLDLIKQLSCKQVNDIDSIKNSAISNEATDYFKAKSPNLKKHSSSQKLRESPFYSYVKFQSPRMLINKRYQENGFEAENLQHHRQSFPFLEPYNEIASKMFLVGTKSPRVTADLETLFPHNNQSQIQIKSREPPKLKTLLKEANEENNEKEVGSSKTLKDAFQIFGAKKYLRNTTKHLRTEENLTKSSIYEIKPLKTEANNEDEQKLAKKKGLLKEPYKKESYYLSRQTSVKNAARTFSQEEGSTSEVLQAFDTKVNNKGSEENSQKMRLSHAASYSRVSHEGHNQITSKQAKVQKKNSFISENLQGTNQLPSKEIEIYREFLASINFSYNFRVKQLLEKPFTYYKIYIGKGNNHILIRSLIRNRPWWVQTDNKDPKEINFMWTQSSNKRFIESLKSLGSHENEDDQYHSNENNNRSIQTSQAKTVNQRKELGLIDDKLERLFTQKEREILEKYKENLKTNFPRDHNEETLKNTSMSQIREINDLQKIKICNHIEGNFYIGDKKFLLLILKNYYESINDQVTNYLPLTFHIRNGLEDEEFQRFIRCYTEREKELQETEGNEKEQTLKKRKNIWILKPGENTNKGKGISLVNSLEEIKEAIICNKSNKESKTYLIQQYLEKPLLYNKRKFDIRCYMLISCINGVYKGYWYQEGYLRTSSKEFNLKNIANKQIHLTNDAIQKKFDDYGKWETGNKLSYCEFERYLETTYKGTVNFYKNIYPQMKSIATDTIRAAYGIIDPQKRENTFEIFGLDFMIDSMFKVWLIEVNSNPDITIPCPKLGILIPNMIENAFRIVIDPLFPPNDNFLKKMNIPKNILENNKFELVFDEVEESHILNKTLRTRKEDLKKFSENFHINDYESLEEDMKD